MSNYEKTEASETAATPPTAMTFESHGVDTVPLAERQYRPYHIFAILYGSDLTYSVIIFGSFPILFGLGWWDSVTSILVGCLIGGALLGPMSLFGPKTGTNNAVSSGAHFGIAGRFIGSFLALFSALGFSAITIWTSGDALVSGVARLAGTQTEQWQLAIGYAVIAVVVVFISVRGIHLMLRIQSKIMMPLMSFVLLVGVFAFAPQFDAGYAGGALLFPSFAATWIASTLVIASVVLSYGVFIGDWSRYINPKLHPQRRTAAATFLGGFIGLGLPILWGAYVTSTFASDAGNFIAGLMAHSPIWYVVGLVIIGLIAGVAQGTIGMYGTGLDTSSLIPRLNRVQSTLLIAVVAIALVYLGAFVWDAVATVNAFLILLLVVTAPWIVIMAIGYFHRRGHYLPDDLQVFTRHQRGGRYWFNRGWNWRAAGAWIPASVVGVLLAAAPPVFIGPWANIANGVDLSFISAVVIAAVLYTAFLIIFPEPDYVFGPAGGRLGRVGKGLAAQPIRDVSGAALAAPTAEARP